MTEFAGEFETHITIDVNSSRPLGVLHEWSLRNGLKCVHIVLDRGQQTSQPMLTRHGRGVLSIELAEAERIARELTAEGFVVSRIKIEASPFNQDVPLSVAEGLAEGDIRYFEHHVKLLLAPGADRSGIVDVAERHSAHLSRNALRRRPDGQEERFVTQRCRRMGRSQARQELEALVAALRSLGHPVAEIEEEYVVYDSNLKLDSGWIAGEEN